MLEVSKSRSYFGVSYLLVLLLSPNGFAGNPNATTTVTIPTYDRVRVLTDARTIQDVELTDQNGQPFLLSELRGQVALVFFGFTNCPDVCPLAMQRFRQLEASSGDEMDDVAFVLISVDGKRDTPDVMKAYLKLFSPRFIGLTGDPGIVRSIARQFSAVFFKENALDANGNYNVSHSPQVFVLDPVGRLRAEFYNASIEAMHGVTLALLKEAREASRSAHEPGS